MSRAGHREGVVGPIFGDEQREVLELIARGAPLRGASTNPAILSAAKRRRHLPTVFIETPSP